MLSFDAGTQMINARDEAGKLRWQAELVVEDKRGSHRYRGAARGGGRAGAAGPWRIGLELSSEGVFDLVRVTVRPRPQGTLRRLFLRLLAGKGAVPALTSPRSMMLGLAENPFDEKGVLPLGKGRAISSRFFTVLQGPAGRSILAGVGELGQDFSLFRTEGETLEAGFEPGRRLHSETRYSLAFAAGKDPLEMMEAYGRYLKRFARTSANSVAGWNSWDYYGGAVTMDDMRREMAAINASPLKEKLTHVAIDMGWWTDWGDVQPNRRFPASLRAAAKEIAQAGFVPGIWYAPLQCSPWTFIGRHRQELLVPDESSGRVMQGGQALLDWSKPEVLQLLYDWFSDMRSAGFRYFKLDYIYSDAVRAMTYRADQSIGPLAVIRNGLKVIREAVGEDAYILNCGAARECAVGITDASRICNDIHTFWSHVYANAREIACHLWEQGNLWNIDPDFAVVRSPQTSDDPFPNYAYQRRPWTERTQFWMAGPEATFDELKTWLTVTHLAGGDLFLSDSIARLNRTGIAALGKLFPRLDRAARPLDLFINPRPRFWLARAGRMSRLGIFNWEDQPAPIVLPAGLDLPSDGVDVWSGVRVKVTERTVMAPRSAYLLRL
jgi:hypothetical protein